MTWGYFNRAQGSDEVRRCESRADHIAELIRECQYSRVLPPDFRSQQLAQLTDHHSEAKEEVYREVLRWPEMRLERLRRALKQTADAVAQSVRCDCPEFAEYAHFDSDEGRFYFSMGEYEDRLYVNGCPICLKPLTQHSTGGE